MTVLDIALAVLIPAVIILAITVDLAAVIAWVRNRYLD
jgi:hypothetical protein